MTGGGGVSQELKCQELMGVATQESTNELFFDWTVVYTTQHMHNQQQHCDVKMETSSNTYRSLLSDIKYL